MLSLFEEHRAPFATPLDLSARQTGVLTLQNRRKESGRSLKQRRHVRVTDKTNLCIRELLFEALEVLGQLHQP